MIALLCDALEQMWINRLSRWDEVRRFPNGVALAVHLQQEKPCAMALVAVDRARGMNWAAYAKHQRPSLPVVWVSEQAEFEPQSRRIPVDGFFPKPVDWDRLEEAVTHILGPPGGSRHNDKIESYKEISP